MNVLKKLSLNLVWVGLLIAGFTANASQFIPVEDLFESSEFKSFDVSPDGKHLIAIAPYQGIDNLFVMNLETMELQVLTNSNKDIGYVYWVNDERVIYGLRDDKKDARSSAGGLVSINIDGSKQKVLIQPFGAQNSKGVTFKGESISVISLNIEDPKYVLIQSNKRREKYPDVYKLNVYTGKKKKVFYNPGRINYYIATPKGRVCFGVQHGEDGDESVTYFYRNENGDWQKKWVLEDSLDRLSFLSVEDNGVAYIAHNMNRDKIAVYRYDLVTGNFEDQPIAEDETYDVEVFERYISGKTGGLVGFSYHRDVPTNFYVVNAYRKLQEQIDSLLPKRFNHPVSASYDGTRIVIRSFSDIEPPFYSLLDIKNAALIPLSRIEKFKKTPLCHTKPVSWKAADGRIIHGYLTLPHSWSKGNPVPMIVRPHGGPWARETWGLTWHFPMERQFYANRGFAVLETNFRGSTGYGKDHIKSSFKNLKQMHSDWVDGTRWAIAEGFADPKCIGIGGASWGGYSTMVGMTKYPEIYSFGINFMGVVDVVKHIDNYLDWDRESAYEYWCKRIGDPKVDEDLESLREFSPIHFLDQMQGPVLIYHGLRDYNVDIDQARMLISRMDKLDLEYTSIIRTDEAHSTHFEDDRLSTYREVDKFLARVLSQN